MKLLKPDWIHHDDKPIFSVDVHPDGNKFATGGQGNDSGRVVIWNLAPVLSVEAECDKSVPKILCQLDNHLACVNCVRWSVNGVLLASGGDDKVIMIWKKGKGPSAVFGNAGITKTTESWRCTATLRGHSGDILDIAWSPQDRWLASCSVDNNVIIWDMHNAPAMVAILKGHTGLVKGVAWDPVGKFIASQSDDRSVKIWKTADWTCHSTITEPFEECGGTTHVLRLSWSPDGLYLVSAHAMNGGGPTAQIIEREGWKCDKDFVGHRKAVTCVRFHNSILKRQAPKTNKSQQYCCLAVGSRDRSLSVWMTALQRPLVVIHDLFQDTILDLSWSTDRNILLACSTDGTVACLLFTSAELGTPLSEDDKNSLYQRMYGKSANIDMNEKTGKDMIVEYAELITNDTDNKSNQSNNNNKSSDIGNDGNGVGGGVTTEISVQNNNLEMLSVTPSAVLPMPIGVLSPKPAIHKQIETRTADGRRRITPMFIPLNQDLSDSAPELSSSSRSANVMNVEKTAASISNIGGSVVPSVSVASKDPVSSVMSVPQRIVEITPEKTQLSTRLSVVAPIKSKTITAPESSSTAVAGSSVESQKITQKPPMPHQSPTKFNALSAGKAIPLQGTFARASGKHRVHVQNSSINTSMGQLCKVSCSSTTITPIKQYWEIFVGSPVVIFCLCAKYVITCSMDGTIRFLNIRTGVLVLPIIKIPSAGVQCAFSTNGELGGVISECGIVRIWNISEQCVQLSTSCSDILSISGHVTQFYITDGCVAFILLSNGCSYSYCKKLESWLVINSRDPITRHGITSTTAQNYRNIITYPLGSIQNGSNNSVGVGGGSGASSGGIGNYCGNSSLNARHFSADISTSNWQHSARLSFIENQINICESINSPLELEHWYSMLGSHLAVHGSESRIRILLDDLLGSTMHTTNVKSLKILNIDKHILLEKVLVHLKQEPRWQRIYMEYVEQLNDIKNMLTVVNGVDVDMKND